MPDEAKIEPWIEVAAQKKKIADLEDDAGYTVRAGAFVPVIAEAYRSRESANGAAKKETTVFESATESNISNFHQVDVSCETVMERHLREELKIANTHLVSARSDAHSLASSHGLLLEALRKYGRHSQDCDSHAPLTIRDNRVKKCTCGFEAAIALAEKEGK